MEPKRSSWAMVVLVFVLLAGHCFAATQSEIETAIADGVAWLAAQQNSSEGYWEDRENRAGPTGLALVKLQERAFELGYTPFDPSYPYREHVEKGLAYLFSRLSLIDISAQPYGNPDTDGDGKGLYVSEHATYDTGIAMMAIASSRAPDLIVNAPGSPVHGWTYKQVLTDLVDYMAYGQYDYAPSRGGWGYSDNASSVDNSNSGYAVSGQGYAQSAKYGFECVIPQFVKDELLLWADYVQTDGGGDEDGGSGYTAPGIGNILRTGNLIYQMTFAERESDHTNVQRALNYIGRKWNDANTNPGWGNPAYYTGSPHFQAMYCAANGLSYAKINEITVNSQLRDWYADFSDAIVDSQQTNGSWNGDLHGGAVLSTIWALLALERPAFLLDLIKTDTVGEEPNCVSPGQTFTYSICWTNDSGQTIEDAYIIDRLPGGVDYDYFDFDTMTTDPNYSIEDHTYTWFLGDIAPNESGCVQLTVMVNNKAEPGLDLYNVAEMYDSADRMVGRGDRYTPVCCWDDTEPDIIYVDHTANGDNNGTNWTDAYTDLADALYRAANSQCVPGPNTIYVAQGTYSPGENEGDGFVLPENVSVYGGFPTGGCDFAYRNPKKYETILTGLIDETTIADKTVTMGDETLLDGFTVKNALDYNIYGSRVDFTVSHCTVKECLFGYGIYAENGNVSVQWTTVNSNGTTGLHHQGEGYDLTVANSWLLRNGAYGILCELSTPTITNSIVSESSMTEQGREGVYIKNPTHQPKLFNLTVANNKFKAIYFEDDGDITGDPNFPDYPDLQNSILFFNGGDSQIIGFNPDQHANFCCIQDCNTLDTTNFNDMPGFAYQMFDPNGVPVGVPDPNNYHLAPNSVCIDRGNPDPSMGYELQADFDNELRLFGDFVDVGADEVYDCDDGYVSEADVHNDHDWDADGIVNFVEFDAFSRAWLSRSPDEYTDPNLIANWNPKCNLADTGASQYVIDLADLMNFVEDTPWLWIACWKLEEINAMTTMMAGGEEMLFMGNAVTAEECHPGLRSGVQMVQPEPTIDEKILQLQDAIEFLEQIWLEEQDLQQQISPKDWREFMDSVYQSLTDLNPRDSGLKAKSF